MKTGSWFRNVSAGTSAAMLAALTWGLPPVAAQGVGFLTEQQQLASYCTGALESRIRELGEFIKSECDRSHRKECAAALGDLDRAQAMDRRLWAYVTTKIFASEDQGPLERALAQRAMDKGGNDWFACNHRDPRTSPDDLAACREAKSCLIDSRFSFLPP
jgi:hypothetical protein